MAVSTQSLMKHWVMGDMTILPEPNQEQQTAETVIAGKP